MVLKRARAALLLVGALVAGVVSVLLVAGCSPEVSPTVTPSVKDAPDTTITGATTASTVSTAASSQPITSRWPPGIEAVVLSGEDGLYVVDASGVRWSQEAEDADQPLTTDTVRGPQIVSGLDGLGVSSNDEFIAYVEDDKEIVVRSIADGTVTQRATVQTEGHTWLRAISSDGVLAALVTVDPQAEGEDAADEVPWSVTVVDLSSGTATVEKTLNDFVRQRIEDGGRCGLTTLKWLPEYKLLVGLSGDPYETYLYEPVADRLEVIPQLDYIWDLAPGGLVLGTSMGDPAEAVLWNARDGSYEPVVLDTAWPNAGHGGVNADGTALVLMVAKSADWNGGHGWQVFRREGSEWRAAGPVAEVDWMHQPPSLLSNDAAKAWTVVPQSTADNETVLLSHDFKTGAWEEWFRSEDMRVDLGPFGFAAVVLED